MTNYEQTGSNTVVVVYSLSPLDSFETPWTIAHQAPLIQGISQARILECHFLLQGIFPTQGSNLCLLHWQAGSLPLSPRKPRFKYTVSYTDIILYTTFLMYTSFSLLRKHYSLTTDVRKTIKFISLKQKMPNNHKLKDQFH